MIRHIMLATDFSERSDRALRRATLIARRAGARVTLVHVVDDDQPRRVLDAAQQSALELLNEQVETLRDVDGIQGTARVALGTAFDGILQAAQAESPDLLVIGPHRRRLLRDMFLGTTAERTIRQSPCPVLMVNAPPIADYRHVLLSTDLSEGSRRALEIAFRLEIAPQAALSLVFVFDAPLLRLAMHYTVPEDERAHYLRDERREAALKLAQFRATLSVGQIDCVLRYDKTTVANEILCAAAELSADLIVIGTRGASGFTKLVLGSVAEEVLRRTTRDVLVVPPGSPP
jgi:nucleotide-binding universal stress UspA family protein